MVHVTLVLAYFLSEEGDNHHITIEMNLATLVYCDVQNRSTNLSQLRLAEVRVNGEIVRKVYAFDVYFSYWVDGYQQACSIESCERVDRAKAQLPRSGSTLAAVL